MYTDSQIFKNTVTKNGNVIGRGALGGLVFGPAGAIVGGMSARNSKTRIETTEEKTYYLVINYKKTKSSPTSSITFKTKNFYKPSDIEIFIGNLRPLINEKMNIEL